MFVVVLGYSFREVLVDHFRGLLGAVFLLWDSMPPLVFDESLGNVLMRTIVQRKVEVKMTTHIVRHHARVFAQGVSR